MANGRCPKCSAEVSAQVAVCPRCGAALDPGDLPTLGAEAPASAPSDAPSLRTPRTPHTPQSSSWSSDVSHEGGFAPGQMFAGRYRIVGLLGRGGMGQVYRADDLKLGQTVALKFMSPAMAANAALRQRFYGEVRLARDVSHPNVCRVYDVGEAEGRLYLTMEYVDGEDLASLLKRIGRLPPDKAVDIARELCAGLAAAHERGVVHRDLKPANVMLDGRGHARITDFGLAVPLEGGEAREFAGTPAYMAPEQLTGGTATLRTDLYALGLIFYEIFTGHRFITAKTLAERRKTLDDMRPPSVSHISGIDAAVERVIQRCLESDPQQRPLSARAVAAALPGGDPLAAALAAGETPSPELVAASGETGGLRPAIAVAALAAVVAGLLFVMGASQRTTVTGLAPMDLRPEVLTAKAQEITRSLGHTAPPADWADFFARDGGVLRYVRSSSSVPGRWDQLRSPQPPVMVFGYRQSPRPLVPANTQGRVLANDPPFSIPEGVILFLDMQGRLLEFRSLPPQDPDTPVEPGEPDWGLLLKPAGLDMATLTAAEPRWPLTTPTDLRAAWTGNYPDRPEMGFRAEAGAYRGRIVYFAMIPEWREPARAEAPPPAPGATVFSITYVVSFIIMILGGAFFARRNLRLGRGDTAGAWKVAGFVVLMMMAAWLLRAKHTSTPMAELELFNGAIGRALYNAGRIWLVYVALEPFVRRRWPQILISWQRLMGGRLRDPMVGSSVLFGVLGGVGFLVLQQLRFLAPEWLGMPASAPETGSLNGLGGLAEITATFLGETANAAGWALYGTFLMLLFRLLLRRDLLAAIALAGVTSIFFAGDNVATPYDVATALVQGALCTVLFVRSGVMTAGVALFTFFFLSTVPLTLDMNAWYATRSWIFVAAIAALAAWGFHVSLAGQRVLAGVLAEEEA